MTELGELLGTPYRRFYHNITSNGKCDGLKKHRIGLSAAKRVTDPKVQRLGPPREVPRVPGANKYRILTRIVLEMSQQPQLNVVQSILSIKEKSSQRDLPMESCRLEHQTAKYSSQKTPIWHLYINDIRITKKSDILIRYRCSQCDGSNEIGTTQFLRKLRAGKRLCFQCTLEAHNQATRPFPPSAQSRPSNDTLVQKHEKSLHMFETFPDEYRHAYFLRHLTEADFERLKPRMVSLCNGKYTNLSDMEYWSIYRVHNQMTFSSVVYHRPTDTIFKAHQPIMVCENCDSTWRAKSLEKFKQCYKILCPDCTLCNRTFKVRTMHNVQGQLIMYQSKPEKRFIEWCHGQGLVVCNGPRIEYHWEGKPHMYRVDFEVGGYLIEIKDNHIWHRNQVKNGKWGAKEDAAIAWCNTHGYKGFRKMTPQNWTETTLLLSSVAT